MNLYKIECKGLDGVYYSAYVVAYSIQESIELMRFQQHIYNISVIEVDIRVAKQRSEGTEHV